MKQIQIENGVIRYYGNRVGRVTEGCAVVDPMFQNEALESFLRKQRNIQKIQWQDGIYDRLANSQQDMESAKGLKDVRIWQLRGDVDVHMKFLALFQMEQQYGSPKPDFYIKVYEGASDTNDLEELYDKFRYQSLLFQKKSRHHFLQKKPPPTNKLPVMLSNCPSCFYHRYLLSRMADRECLKI